ncbi:MAG: hypothetical protein ABI658_10425, partial [Acidimicrobiales bacterium]
MVATVDATDDGGAGRPLRVNFVDQIVDAGFEDGLTGWTALNQRIDLGTTTIASCLTVDTSTYSVAATHEDNDVPAVLGAMSANTVTSGSPTEGASAAQLQAGISSAQLTFDVLHGPAIFSSQFYVSAGSKIDFDWRGVAGIDRYHVFGYLLDGDCTQTVVLDATGTGTSSWITVESTVVDSGTYRLVFVGGTFDSDGGLAMGASLFVDNVRVESPAIDDALVQKIGRKLLYANSSFPSATMRTVDVTAQSALDGTGLGSMAVNLVLAPVITDHGYLGLVPARLWDSRSGAKPAAGSVRELVVVG